MRLEHFLASHAKRRHDKTALIAQDQRITFGQLHQSILALAHGLRSQGVGVGSVVLLHLPNGAPFVQSMYACMMLGAIVVPVNTRHTPKELAYFAQDSKAQMLIHHAQTLDALKEVDSQLEHLKRVIVGQAGSQNLPPSMMRFEDLLVQNSESLPPVPLNADVCLVMYTSGTTGKPKGVIITHANMIIQHAYINAVDWGISSQDKYLVTTPLTHRTGMARMLNALSLGGTLVVLERFEPLAALKAIEQEAVTAMGMVPTIARMLMPELEKNPKSCASLRHAIVTGEAFPVDIKRRFIDLLPQVRLHSFFAMTEVGAVTGLEHEEQFTHPTSVGCVTPGIEVRLVDDHDCDVPVGQAGELLVRSGVPGNFTTMRGYFDRPQETAATISADGWVRTGDIARFDNDGYLYIVDRKKDMILSGGFNIYTKEVEHMLLDHEAISDAAVVGVPDPIFGEAVAAFIELKPGAQLTQEQVLEHSKGRIASYKKPKYIYFVQELPRNPLGKLLKAQLREKLISEFSSTQGVHS